MTRLFGQVECQQQRQQQRDEHRDDRPRTMLGGHEGWLAQPPAPAALAAAVHFISRDSADEFLFEAARVRMMYAPAASWAGLISQGSPSGDRVESFARSTNGRD